MDVPFVWLCALKLIGYETLQTYFSLSAIHCFQFHLYTNVQTSLINLYKSSLQLYLNDFIELT